MPNQIWFELIWNFVKIIFNFYYCFLNYFNDFTQIVNKVIF